MINPCQRLNPLLENIRNVNKEFGDVVPDFQVGRTTGVLYLSLKYHRLHPEYIYQRVERLGNMYTLRILLLMCDITEHQEPIREITKTCLINNITVLIAWTLEEAGFYLSTLKAYEHKPPDLIKERVDKDYGSMYRTSLTSIARINKTDVESLKLNIGSIADVAIAPQEQMQMIPGLGRIKVRRIKEAFEKPFRPTVSQPSNPVPPNHESIIQVINHDADVRNNPNRDMDERLSSKRRQPVRSPSPVWDIELDLNQSDAESN